MGRWPDGASPSGKAPVFGTGIRRFESCRPSHPASPVGSVRLDVNTAELTGEGGAPAPVGPVTPAAPHRVSPGCSRTRSRHTLKSSRPCFPNKSEVRSGRSGSTKNLQAIQFRLCWLRIFQVRVASDLPAGLFSSAIGLVDRAISVTGVRPCLPATSFPGAVRDRPPPDADASCLQELFECPRWHPRR